ATMEPGGHVFGRVLNCSESRPGRPTPRRLKGRTLSASPPKRWGNRPAACGKLKILGAALQADGETRSVGTASSIRRRSAALTILLDWTYRSRRRASALWMTQARSFGK